MNGPFSMYFVRNHWKLYWIMESKPKKVKKSKKLTSISQAIKLYAKSFRVLNYPTVFHKRNKNLEQTKTLYICIYLMYISTCQRILLMYSKTKIESHNFFAKSEFFWKYFLFIRTILERLFITMD